MKVNQNYEVEVSLKDLLFNILYKWRIILLVALLFACFFGFKEFWGFEKYHKEGKMTPEEEKYEESIAANQKALEKAEYDVAEYEKIVKDYMSYQEKSAIMNLNPNSIWTAEKKYFLNMYTADLQNPENMGNDSSGKILTILSEAFDVDNEDLVLREAFGTDVPKDISEVVTISIDREQKTISVVACGLTKEEALHRKDIADSYLLSASEQLSKTEYFILEEIGNSITVKSVLTTKSINGEKIEKDLAKIQNASHLQYKDYIALLEMYTSTRNSILNRTFTKPISKTVNQAVLGFALGSFLIVSFYTLLYLLNGRLKTARELKKRYNLSLLGEFSHSRAWWKGKGIDGILERLEFGKKTIFDNEIKSIASLIDCERDGETVLLTSSLDEKKLKELYNGLSVQLQEKGVKLEVQPEFLHNSNAVVASTKLNSVLLVEEKYKSKIRDLNRMAEMLTIENAKVIGAVLL